MKTTTLAIIAGTMLVARVAAAQDEPPLEGDTTDEPPPGDTVHTAPARLYQDEAPPAVAEPRATRPEALSIGIGVGYRFPTELNLPNVTSVRFRLPSGLTFEPQLTFARQSTSTDDGITEEDDLVAEVGVAVEVRVPFRAHRKVDFVLLGAAGIDNVTDNPEGDNNSQTTRTIGLGYGVGLDYWINDQWNLSFSARNPILTNTSSSREIGPGAPEVSQSVTTIGLVWDPTVTVMLHLHL
jgi:hypothetical protein